MISLIFTPSVWNSVFLPLIIRLDVLSSHKYDHYGDYAWHNPCGLAVTCRGDAELLLPHFLQLQDLLQSLRYLRSDANIFPLPRLNTNQTQVKIREETEFICQTDHALRLSHLSGVFSRRGRDFLSLIDRLEHHRNPWRGGATRSPNYSRTEIMFKVKTPLWETELKAALI